MISGFVSVIIPTYRRDAVLLRALNSVAEQTYRDYEIIIVDDNADGAWNCAVASLVDLFCSQHPDISVRYIRNETNLGSAQTRNVGIHASRGEFICFLDDDDVYLPNRLSHQLCPMRDADADFSITDLNIYNEHDKLVDVRKRSYLVDETQLLKYHLMHHITGTDTIMFKRDYLLRIGCFDPINVGDEFYLMTKAIQQGGKFLYVPGCEVKAYLHTGDGGLSSGQGKIDGENQLFAYKKHFFDRLDRAAIRYINMRHYAVLAYAHLRSRNYVLFLLEGLRAVACAPFAAIQLMMGHV